MWAVPYTAAVGPIKEEQRLVSRLNLATARNRSVLEEHLKHGVRNFYIRGLDEESALSGARNVLQDALHAQNIELSRVWVSVELPTSCHASVTRGPELIHSVLDGLGISSVQVCLIPYVNKDELDPGMNAHDMQEVFGRTWAALVDHVPVERVGVLEVNPYELEWLQQSEYAGTPFCQGLASIALSEPRLKLEQYSRSRTMAIFSHVHCEHDVNHPEIQRLATHYGEPPAKVLVSYYMQRGHLVLLDFIADPGLQGMLTNVMHLLFPLTERPTYYAPTTLHSFRLNMDDMEALLALDEEAARIRAAALKRAAIKPRPHTLDDIAEPVPAPGAMGQMSEAEYLDGSKRRTVNELLGDEHPVVRSSALVSDHDEALAPRPLPVQWGPGVKMDSFVGTGGGAGPDTPTLQFADKATAKALTTTVYAQDVDASNSQSQSSNAKLQAEMEKERKEKARARRQQQLRALAAQDSALTEEDSRSVGIDGEARGEDGQPLAVDVVLPDGLKHVTRADAKQSAQDRDRSALEQIEQAHAFMAPQNVDSQDEVEEKRYR